MAKDLYELLGVNKNASEDEIKSAYRKMALKYHPDRFASASDQEKKSAEEKFKEINHAYEVLSNKTKKDNYDRYGNEDGPQGFGGGGGAGVKIDPVAFLTIKDGVTRVLPVAAPPVTTLDRIVEMAPDLMDKAEKFLDKKKAEKEQETL